MHAAVIVFPGSNCDRDLAVAFEKAGAKVSMVWHKDTDLPRGVDIVGTPLTSFGKIIAAADDYDVFNGACGAESGSTPEGQRGSTCP